MKKDINTILFNINKENITNDNLGSFDINDLLHILGYSLEDMYKISDTIVSSFNIFNVKNADLMYDELKDCVGFRNLQPKMQFSIKSIYVNKYKYGYRVKIGKLYFDLYFNIVDKGRGWKYIVTDFYIIDEDGEIIQEINF